MIKILKQWYAATRKEYLLRRALDMHYPTCSFEKGLVIKGPLENMTLEDNVLFQSNVMIHLGGMDWCQNRGKLHIGANSVISPNVVIYAAGSGGVHIGSNFDCGPGVKIFSSHSDMYQHNQHIFGEVTIGNNVILFANVVISPGVNIGSNSVILASAVVIEDVPPNMVYGGIPAKLIKNIF